MNNSDYHYSVVMNGVVFKTVASLQICVDCIFGWIIGEAACGESRDYAVMDTETGEIVLELSSERYFIKS